MWILQHLLKLDLQNYSHCSSFTLSLWEANYYDGHKTINYFNETTKCSIKFKGIMEWLLHFCKCDDQPGDSWKQQNSSLNRDGAKHGNINFAIVNIIFWFLKLLTLSTLFSLYFSLSFLKSSLLFLKTNLRIYIYFKTL